MAEAKAETKAKAPVAPVAPVAKSNGDVLAALTSESAALFARRLAALEQASIRLRHLYREHAQCLIAEKQHKADIYLHSDARSHGEREGQASAMSVSLSAETLLLKGEISALEEETSLLRFFIEQDGGA